MSENHHPLAHTSAAAYQQAQANPLTKTRLIVLALLGAGILSVALLVSWLYRPQKTSYTTLSEYLASLPDGSFIQTTIGERSYQLEIANTAGSISHGLSDRAQIGSDGMIFVMPSRAYHSFWMPRMHFDLDLVFLDEDRIVQIIDHVPAAPADMPQAQMPLYTNDRLANLVIELPAGRTALNNIQVGDTLVVPAFAVQARP